MVDAATELFLRDGYGSVTIQAIARAAGVSTQMVYAAFGSKAGVLAKAVDVALGGDDEDVELFERDEIQAALASDDPRTFVRGVAGAARVVHGRSAAILHVVDSVAGADPAVEELRRTYVGLRRTDTRRVLARLPTRGLRTDLDLERLADFIDYLGRSASYTSLVVECGWTPDEYQDWYEDFMYRFLYPG